MVARPPWRIAENRATHFRAVFDTATIRVHSVDQYEYRPRFSSVISIVELNTYAVYADESLIAKPSLMRDADAAQDTTTIQRRCHIYDNKQRRGRRSAARCDAQFDGAGVRLDAHPF